MSEVEAKPIVLFDGVCVLCNGSVQFIIRHDPHKRFLFGSLQSVAGQRLLEQYNLPRDVIDSIVLIESEHVYNRSSAALRIARRLRFPWPVFAVFLAIPGPIRDVFYKLIAKNRYRWFGKREACMMPTPDIKERFLKDGLS